MNNPETNILASSSENMGDAQDEWGDPSDWDFSNLEFNVEQDATAQANHNITSSDEQVFSERFTPSASTEAPSVEEISATPFEEKKEWYELGRIIESSLDSVKPELSSRIDRLAAEDKNKNIRQIRGVKESLAKDLNNESLSEMTVNQIVNVANKIENFSTYVSQSQSLRSFGEQVRSAIKVVGESKDEKCLPVFLEYWRELRESPDDDFGQYVSRSSLVSRYFEHQGIDEKRVDGFRNNVFPMIDAKDPEVEVLQRAGNSWGMGYGEYGISDYTIHCLVSEVNPQNTQELVQAYREIPTSDFRRFEQNRIDAAALQGVLYGGRDFIHDEQPGVNELLSAMLDYYDSRNDEARLSESTAKLEQIIAERLSRKNSGYYRDLQENAMNLENYSKDVTVKNTYQIVGEKKPDYQVPAVDVLRRMVENTKTFDADNRPQTEDKGLNALIQQLDIRPNERTGEVGVDWNQVGELVKYANNLLNSRQGQTGMRPSTVSAIAYTEKIATYAMRGISKKDWQELPYDPAFKEICRFQELTSSADNYSEANFEQFWEKFSRVPYSEDGDFSVLQEHYKQLATRRLNQVNAFAKKYNSNEHTTYMTGSLWSGNLNHEIIGLTDAR